MLAGTLCAFVLVLALVVVRSGAHRREAAARAAASRGETIAAAFAVLLTALPFARLFPWIAGSPVTHFGDALSHVHVARDIVRHGLPHGWVDTYLAGFPFGHHYPPLGTLLLALTLKFGWSPAAAAHLVGVAATLGTSVTLFWGAVRAGARPAFATAGAAFVAWVSPYNPFVGGYEAFFQLGIISQVLALPLCVGFAAVVASGARFWPAILGALMVATHPQLAMATLAVVGVASVACGRRDVLARFVRGAAGTLAFGLALYGQGILTLRVPFGWPPGLGWRQLGFGTNRFDWWFLDGDLLDRGREVPVLTALAAASVLGLALRATRPAARAALASAGATIAFSAVGPALSRLEPVGPAILAVIQPLRVLSLVPPVTAALVVVVLEESAPLVRNALATFGRARLAALGSCLPLLVVAAVLVAAVPQRVGYASKLGAELARRASGACDVAPAGYSARDVERWVGALRGGRLWFEDGDGALERCLVLDGVPLASSVPIGITGSLGAHVGIHWLAYHVLEPERAGSERRAEALGVRHLLVVSEPKGGWTERRRSGDVRLFSHERPTDQVGVGCVVERLTGDDRALRGALVAELKTEHGADRLLDPNRLVALEHSQGPISRRTFGAGACDATNARVTLVPREPGALEAVVESASAVDVVFRATAFPTWRIFVDGAPAPRSEVVAPGFVATRVPPGRHRVIAAVSSMPGYLAWLTLGALAVAAASALRREHVARAFARVRSLGAARRSSVTGT